MEGVEARMTNAMQPARVLVDGKDLRDREWARDWRYLAVFASVSSSLSPAQCFCPRRELLFGERPRSQGIHPRSGRILFRGITTVGRSATLRRRSTTSVATSPTSVRCLWERASAAAREEKRRRRRGGSRGRSAAVFAERRRRQDGVVGLMVAGPLRPLRLRPPSPAPRYQPPVPAAATPLPWVVPGILGFSPRPPTPRLSSILSPLGRPVSTPARAMYVHVHPSRFRSCRRPSGGTIVRMGSREGGEPPGTITTSEKRSRGSSDVPATPGAHFPPFDGMNRVDCRLSKRRKERGKRRRARVYGSPRRKRYPENQGIVVVVIEVFSESAGRSSGLAWGGEG